MSVPSSSSPEKDRGEDTAAVVRERTCYAWCPGPDGCDCFDKYGIKWPIEPLTPLSGHGRPAGLLRSLWIVLRGVRLYV